MKKDLFFDLILAIGLLFMFAYGIFKLVEERTENRREYEQQLEKCFKQEPKSQDCKFFLYKHELKYRR